VTTVPRHERYRAFTPLDLPDRTWPGRTTTVAPRWLSTDLRDGNQALATPMSPARKLEMFDLLVGMGYKEIEVGFPVASQDEFDFVRQLIEQDLIPDDVRISVLVQARDELIRRTVDSLRGARQATIHLYHATAPLFRQLVFGMTRQECRQLAVRGTELMMRYAESRLGGCDLDYQYSPELFNETEAEFALEVCEAVMDVWQPGPDRGMILNFPTTVERSQPNRFADQIEWLDRNLTRRRHVCLSVHPHNDRGTGVASAELALLAGAQRIEGCLFGSGERAGNVCLVTLGLNLLTQGVDPGIDFSDLERIRRTVEASTGMEVPKRHPYAGELVYTAFSGSHQDAIKKGFDALAAQARSTGADVSELPWEVPYLPLDPADVGRSYEGVVRVNSQSGKGGVAHVLSSWHGLELPRGLQIEFARTVQAAADAAGTEIGPARIRQLFDREYRSGGGEALPAPRPGQEPVPVVLYLDGAAAAAGEDALDALGAGVRPLDIDLLAVHRTGAGADGPAVVYAHCSLGIGTFWGVGIDSDPCAAAVAAVRAAVRRAGLLRPATLPEPAPPARRGRARRLPVGAAR
jgi:2-isopropylmalate synthase